MARVPDLRQPRSAVATAAVGLLAAVAAFAFLLVVRPDHRPATAPLVARALGPVDPSARLDRRYAPGTSGAVTASGIRVGTKSGPVSLRLVDAPAGSWTRHTSGADRATPFGRESIVFQPQGLEELLTVGHAQGRRTWRWQLDGVHGRVDPAGGVVLRTLHGDASDSRVAPVLILDGKGGNVTPLGLRWHVTNGAHGAALALTFDDRHLPLPYVIDPAIALLGACGFDTSSASSAAGCSVGQTSKGTSLTIQVPGSQTGGSGIAAGTLMIAQVTVNGTSAITAPNCNGSTKWTQIGTTTQNSVEQAIYWCVPTAAVAAATNYVWTYGSNVDASGGITAWSNVNTAQPVDLSATNPGPGWAATSGTGTSIPTPTAYANQAGTQILAFYGGQIANNGTIVQNAGAGITQDYTVNSTTSNSRARSTLADIAQSGTGAATTLTATASSSIPWVAQTIALQAPYSADGGGTVAVSPTSVNKASTGNSFTFTYTAASGGTNSGSITVVVPAGWTAPTTAAGNGNVAVSCASCFGTAPSIAVTGTGPWTVTVSNVSLAEANTLALTYSGVTAPAAAGTATFTTKERSSSTGTLTNLAVQPTVAVLGQPSAVSFTAGSSAYAATTTYTEQFTATASGALVAGNTVTVTFDPAYAGKIPASPAVSFGGSFAGCAAGATGSTSSAVVTITLPAGCSLSNGSTGTVAIAGVTNPAATTYAAAGFKLRTTADAVDASATSPVTIAPKALTMSGVTASNKTYDGTAGATLAFGGASLVGVVGGDTVTLNSGSATGTFPAKTIGAGLTVTVAGVTLGGASAANYTLTQPTTTASITAAPLTVTGVTAANKVYNGTTAATLNTTSAALSGVVAGDSVNLSTAGATGSFGTKAVGTGKTVTVSGLTISGADAGNYTLAQPTTTANVTAATLTVTGVTAANRTYDTTTAATVNAGSAALVGVVAGDAVTLSGAGASGSFATKTVGTGKTVTVSGLTISGADAGNYTLTQPTTTANVTAATLTVTGVTAANRTYDGTTVATLGTGSAALAGVLGTDVVTLSTAGASGAFATKTVGVGKAVTVAGLALGGADAGNYTLTQPSLTASITAKALTVSGVSASNKVYDRTTAAALTGTASLAGVVAGDAVTLGGSPTATFADRNVGAGKTVTVAGYTISGADSANYTLTQPSLTASITAAVLTVTGVTAANKSYDATTGATLNTTGAALTGVIAGDTVTLSTTGATGSFTTKTVATAKTVTVTGLTIAGADATNYTLTQPTTTADITAKTLTVTGVTAADKTYDATTGATLNTTGAALTGVIAGDTVTLSTTGATGSFATKTVGTAKTVTVTGLTIAGADATNYTLTQPTTTADITAKTLTVTGVTAQDKVYDGGTGATLSGSPAPAGVAGADTVSIGGTPTAAFADRNTGPGKAVTVTGYTLGGGDAANYTLTQPALTASITPKALTISGAVAAGKTYDGTTTAVVNLNGATLNGVVGTDFVSIDASTASATFASRHAGTGVAITVSGVTLGGTDASDYTVAQPSGLSADIAPKTLTVSAAAARNKTYDGTSVAVVDFSGATLPGVVGADSVSIDSSSATTTFPAKTAGTGLAVTVSGLKLAGTDAADYVVSQPTGLTADITKKALTVAGATASDKTYDGTATATVAFGGASLNGEVAGDTVSIDTTSVGASFPAKTVGAALPVTVTGVSLSGADAANYTVAQPSGLTASITRKTLTLSGATAANKVYDGTAVATLGLGGASLTGKVVGDSVALDASGANASFPSKQAGTGLAVSVTGLALSGTDAGDYDLTQPGGLAADITPKALTVDGATAANKVYDGTATATVGFGGATLTGKVAGDAVAIDATNVGASFPSKSVGSGLEVTVTGLALGGADAGDYTLSQPTGLTADITKKTATVAGAVANDKPYDGTTAATVDFSGASLGGAVSGDDVSLDTSGYSASFASAASGAGVPVTVTGVTLSGADAGNYALTQPTGLSADITGRPVTLTGAVADSKTYDGTTAATVSFGGASLSGVVAGDTVSFSTVGYSATFAARTVGTSVAVTVAGVTLTGPDAAKYTLSQPTGLTADITPKPLTVTGAVANDKTYDGTTTATVDFSGATLAGKAAGDAVAIDSSGYTASFGSKSAGTARSVAVAGVSLSGADAGNYTLTQPAGLTADVAPKPLTVTGAAADDKTYDGRTDATVDFTGASPSGVLAGDAVSLDTSGYAATFATKDAGTGIAVAVTGVGLAGADAADYTVSQPADLTADIAAKNLTIANAVAASRAYDGTNVATVDFSGATLTGVVTPDSVSISSASATTTFPGASVGAGLTVTVAGVALAGTDAADYTVSQPTGLTADITKKTLTVSGAVANDKTYDGNTTATVDFSAATLNGVLGSDDVTLDPSGYGATFASPNAGSAIPVTVTGLALAGADRGDYAVAQPSGLAAEITGKPLTLSGASANDKVYDGTAAASVDLSSASLSGVVPGDSVSFDGSTSSAAFASAGAATGVAVTVTGVTLTGPDAGKYTLSQPTGLTADITPKPLTVAGASASDKVYDGTTTAALDLSGATLTGKVAGDTVSIDGSGASAHFATKDAGATVAITVSGIALTGTDANDYTLSQPAGVTATITPKPLTIDGATANDKTYDGTTAATVDLGAATLQGVLAGDAVSIDASAANATFATKHAGTGIPVTLTGVGLTGTDAPDYTVAQPAGLTADITKKTLTVSGAAANDKTYDGNTTATVDFSAATLNGVLGSDDVTLDPSGYGATFATGQAGTGIAVTVTGAGLGGTAAADYTLAQPTGLTARILRKQLTLGGSVAQGKVYDGTAAAVVDFAGASLGGVVGSDAVSFSTTGSGAAFASAGAGANVPVTVTGVTLNGADASNYTLAQPTGLTATIAKKALTVSGASANGKTYDGTTTATVAFGGASLAGKVAGDDVTLDTSSYTASFATRHAGSGVAVTVSGVGLAGTAKSNYTLAQPTGLTATIAQRPLTVTAQPDTKPYDTTTTSSVLPAITAGSLATGDTAGFAQRFAGAAVGTGKPLTPFGSVADGNSGNDYDVTFANGVGTITAAAAAKLVFTQAPSSATGGAAFATQPEVTVEDSYGNVVTSDDSTAVTLAIGTNPSGGTLSCPGSTRTVTVSNGVAAFAGCRIDKKGTGYTLTTTNGGGLADDTTAPFDVVAVSTKLVITSVNGGSSPTAGGGFSVVVEAEDGVGNAGDVASDTPVTLSLASGGGTLGGTLTGTILSGTSSVTISGVTYTKAESGVALTARGGSLADGTSSTFTVDAGPATQLAITVPSSTDAVSAFPVTVEAQDALGNAAKVAADVAVSLGLDSHSGAGAAGTLSGTTGTISTGSSSVTLSGVRYTRAETIALGASAPGMTGSGSSTPITVGPGPLAKLQVLVPGESAAPGTSTGKTGTPAQQTAASPFTIAVNAVDANWNRVSSTHTVSLSSSDAAARLAANTALAGGTASLQVTLSTRGAGTQTVTAADATNGSVSSGTSAAIPVAVGGVSASRSAVSAPTTLVADGTTTGTITVTLRDGGGNPVAGRTVSLGQGAGSSTVSPASAVTSSAGQATFTVKDKTAEVVTYTASDTDDAVTVAQTAAVSFEDHVAPSASLGSPANAVRAAGSLTLTATGVSDGETGVGGVDFRYCDSTAGACSPAAGGSLAATDAGGGTWSAALDTATLTTGHTYTWLAVARDKAANTTTTASRTFSVDNSVPAVAIAAPTILTGASAQHWDGTTSTLWLRGGAAGSFALNATASDAESGIAKVSFPALLGTTAGDATAAPYSSGTYSFSNQPSDLAPVTVTATNGVTAGTGARTAGSSLAIRVDSAGPSSTLDASLDGSTVANGVVLQAASSDAGSGVAQVSFLFCDRTATALCTPNVPAGTTATQVGGVYSLGWDTSGLVDGHSYAISAESTDEVGNAGDSAVSTVVVDDSAPTVATRAPSTSGNAYWNGSKLFLKATGTGSYTLHAQAADADSGIASVTFGADAGTAQGGGDYASPAYTFNGAATSSTVTVRAANGVGRPAPLTATDQVQIVADATPATTATQFPVPSGAYDPTTWPTGSQACTGTQPEGICGTVSDTGSGVAAVKLTLQDLGGGTYFDGTGFSSGPTVLSATIAGTSWSYPLVHTKLSTGSYELEVYGVDEVGNVETVHRIDFDYGTDLTPPDTQLTLGGTHAYLMQVGTHPAPRTGRDYDLFYSARAGGDVTLHAHSSDESGIDRILFPSVFGTTGVTRTNGTANPWDVDSPTYSFDSSDATAPGQAVVTSVDTRGNTGDDTLTFVADDTKPAGGSVDVTPVDGNGYATALNLTLSHGAFADGPTGSGMRGPTTLAAASAALSNGACGTFGADGPAADGAFAAADGSCYRLTATGTDNVGNLATVTRLVKVDTTAPSKPGVAFGGLSAGNTYDDGGGTLWYRPSAGGGFSVTATSTDAESGVQGYTFSSLLGGTQSGGRDDVTFGPAGIGSGTYTVHATNRAALDSADASFSVKSDASAPVNGALTVNGTAAAATATSSYLTSGSSVTIDARTDYTDSGSGLASSTLTVETAALAHDACGTFGAAATIAGTTAQSVGGGTCYRFTLTGTDRVGNVASVSTVVKVDTTPPTTPGVAFSGLSAGNTYDAGNGTLWYRPSAGGTFTVTATGADDPETNVRGFTFSSLLGGTQSGNRLDVAFGAGGVGSGSYGVVATNNASVDSAPAPFTVSADAAAPTGGLLSVAPYSSSPTVSIGETDFADAGSGIASNALTRSDPQAPSGGGCPAGGYTGATAVPLSGGAASDTVPADGSCYEYTLTGVDRVGNTATYTTIVLVDSTAPTGGSVQSPDGLTSLDAVSVDWNAGSDPESGIAQISVERASADLNGSTCDTLGSFTTIVASASTSPVVDSSVAAGNCYAYRIVVTNHAGVAATFAATSVTKLTSASPIAVDSSAGGTFLAGTTLWLGRATSFGLKLTGVGATGVDSADWSTSSGSLSGSAATATQDPFASGTYTWDGTAPLSASVSVTRRPTATVDTLTIASDTTAPTGSVQYPNGINPSHSVPVTTAGVADGGSGVDGGSETILRSETSLVGATCGTTWSAYAPVTISGGNDTTVQDSHCYRYELVVADNVGNQHTDAPANVVSIPDITSPRVASAATNAAGTQLTITMSEPLDAASVPSPSRFTVFFDGVAQPAPTGVAISGDDLVLDLATPPNDSQAVTVSYSSDGSVRDTAAPTKNTTPSFGPSAVTNATTDTVAPHLTSAAVDGSTLTLRLDEALTGNAPAASAFTVTVKGVPRAVAAVATDGTTVTLTLSPAVVANETVLMSYAVPALDALHDAAGNPVAAFTSSVTNSTAAVAVPPVVTPPVVPPAAPSDAPALVTETPSDGVTVAAASSLTLTANQQVAWSGMTLTRPDGSVTALPDGSGAAWTWTPDSAAPGLYVIRGTMAAGGRTTSVLSHFTIWSPSSASAAPTVQKNAGPVAGSVASSDGTVAAAWSGAAFGEPVVVQIDPKSPAAMSLPPSAVVVDVTAFLRDSHIPVTQLGDVVDVQFRNAPVGSAPQVFADTKTWSAIGSLPTLQLPAGQDEGWFRDSDGTVHVLTRHLTYYALIVPQASTKLALNIVTARRLWLDGRRFMAVRIVVTAPARVTGSFVAADGTMIPGQVIRTPTRRPGSTVLRVPVRVTKPGLYRLQVHAEGIGQVVNKTARIRFVQHAPKRIWQSSRRLNVAVVDGVRIGARGLARTLGHGYTVQQIADADLYRAVDPQYGTAAAAVLVDLATVPIPSLASLHALLPELRIVGLTDDRRVAAAARAAGVDVVAAKHAGAKRITQTLTALIRR